MLYRAMGEISDVVDLGPHPNRVTDFALHAAGARRDPTEGNVSLWHNLAVTDRWLQRSVTKRLQAAPVDSVLLVRDMLRLPVPTAAYRDVVFDQLAEPLDDGQPFHLVGHPGFTREHFERRRDRDNELLGNLDAIVVFSQWSAAYLRDCLGLDAQRVHVVAPGVSSLAQHNASHVEARQHRTRRRLLFVGADFRRKGGVELLGAFAHLRRERPDVTLTIIGPSRWPLDTALPDGVQMLGRRSPAEVAEAFHTHDLFVMPSLFEPYGISFVEALSHGLPCIGRDACAMPEILGHGEMGLLANDTTPRALAATIERALGDDALYSRVADAIPATRSNATWQRAAAELLVILRTIA